jgi:hypothetical protein
MEENKVEQDIPQVIDPSKDPGNYLVQIKVGDQVIKQVVAMKATISIISLGDQSFAADIK